MKILFVNVVDEFRRRRMEKDISNLGTGYIAAYLRKYGGFEDIQIVEAGQRFDASKYDADVIGISCVTQNFNLAEKVAGEAKKTRSFVVVGGHHITALPNNLTRDMDVAVLGEGEQTFLELIQALSLFGKRAAFTIPGIAFKDKGHVEFTAKRELIKPLDKIPFPARNLMRLGSHHIVSMYSSRGCPYRCVFCSSAHFWSSLRFFSAKYVTSEISDILAKYSPRRINISDDLFIADKARLKKISRRLRELGYHREVEFRCNVRANLVSREVASLLKAMNVKKVNMGLESGSPRILSYLKGDSVTVEQNERAINILNEYGFDVFGSFIIGSSSETVDDVMDTYRFIERVPIYSGETFVMLPLPGTSVWNFGKENGVLSDSMNWSDFEFYFQDNPRRVIVSDTLTREKLSELLLKFSELWQKKRRYKLAKQAFKQPHKVAPFLLRTLKGVAFKDQDI